MERPHHAVPGIGAITGMDRYREARREFYARLPDFWADTGGKEYALYEVHRLDRDEVQEIRRTAAAIWRIYCRVAALLRTVPDETLLQLGLPAATLSLARMAIPDLPETVIGRLDLVRAPDGYKMLEFNTDTPTFLYECCHINGLLCAEFGLADINAGQSALLAKALSASCRIALDQVGKSPDAPALIAFTSYPNHSEDRRTTEYLRDLVTLPSHIERRYVGIDALRIDPDGLYTNGGDRIDMLYRLYPLEFFARDVDPQTNAPVGEMLFDLVRRRRLALINPPSAFLLQSKAVQVVIWGLYEEGLFFDAEEQAIVAQHLLPTYLDPVFADTPYVVKPVYGREGDTVSIVAPDGDLRHENPVRSFADQSMVYQQYVEMPELEVMTGEGLQRLRTLTSCFLFGGQVGAIGLRLGGLITNDACRFLPIGI
jgi:glutathionylspermidine synthase